MSAISLRIPDSLHKKIKELVRKDNVSINQFITSAVAEKISAFMTEEYLLERSKRGSKRKFQKVLSKVKKREAETFDKV